MQWICFREDSARDIDQILYENQSCKVWYSKICVTKKGKVLDWSGYRDAPVWQWRHLPIPTEGGE